MRRCRRRARQHAWLVLQLSKECRGAFPGGLGYCPVGARRPSVPALAAVAPLSAVPRNPATVQQLKGEGVGAPAAATPRPMRHPTGCARGARRSAVIRRHPCSTGFSKRSPCPPLGPPPSPSSSSPSRSIACAAPWRRCAAPVPIPAPPSPRCRCAWSPLPTAPTRSSTARSASPPGRAPATRMCPWSSSRSPIGWRGRRRCSTPTPRVRPPARWTKPASSTPSPRRTGFRRRPSANFWAGAKAGSSDA